MEAAAPTKRASPRGPGERTSASLRSASRTAKEPQKRPKKPKAEQHRQGARSRTQATISRSSSAHAAPLSSASGPEGIVGKNLLQESGWWNQVERIACGIDRPVQNSSPLRLEAGIDRCKGFVRKTQELRKAGQVVFTVQYLGRLKGN